MAKPGVLRQHECRTAFHLETAVVVRRYRVVTGEQLDRPSIIVTMYVQILEIVVSCFLGGSAHMLLNDWGVLGPDTQASLRRLLPNKDTHQVLDFLRRIDPAQRRDAKANR
ncbi:hypothetical protein D3C77_535290 [compost metagenome]